MSPQARPGPEGKGALTARPFRAAVAAAAAFAVGDFVWLQVHIGGARGTQAFTDLSGCACALAALTTCALAWRRSEGRSRRAWGLFAMSMSFFALGEIAWTTYELGLGRDVPFPSLADIGYLGAIPLAALATISFPTAPDRLTSRVRTVLDALIITTSLFYIGWATVLGPLYRAGEGSLLEQAIGLAYPVGDIMIVSILLFVITRAGHGGRAALLLLAGGLGCLAVSDSSFAVLTLHNNYASGALTDVGWDVGYLLIALAALLPTRIPLRRTTAHHGRVRLLIPYVAVALALVVTGVKRTQGAVEPVLFWGTLGIVTLVVVRQLMMLVENAALTRNLEAQVAEREELIRRAFHDPLTELANRALLRDRLKHALERAARTHRTIAVLYCDLDNFKTINDRFGHAIGDAVLAGLAKRFAGAVRSADTIGRLGGDEFALVIEDGDGRRVADRLLSELQVPFDVGSTSWVWVDASIGVATSDVTTDPDELLRCADIAMYAAKRRGKHRCEVYDETMLGIGEPPETDRVG